MSEAFQATPWSTVAEKQRFYEQYQRWVARGCPMPTKPFYNRLSQMFGHIAHYNKEGFYATWCNTAAHRAALLEYHQAGGAYGVGQRFNGATWSDVENAIAEWLQEDGRVYVEREREAADTEQEARELALLAALKAKYED